MTEVLERAVKAARDGNLEALRAFLSNSPSVLKDTDGDGRGLLDHACRAATGDIAIPLDPGSPEQHAVVEAILAAGADPSAADNDGWTPLHSAGMAGHTDLGARLVKAGARVDAEAYGKAGGSAL
ncbi:MAG: ankyrin repeat domain-containing protein, partial [Gammaproteobacteria bacterium]|nr:ankyrin repeat domain-containing protein [Gammaproteobacteria bacterium]